MLKVRAIVEVLGFPKKHVAETMQIVLDKLKEEDSIKILKQNVAAPKTVKDKKLKERIKKDLWCSFVELELEIGSILRLSHFCFDYLPSSIEILDTEKLDLEANELTSILNDLLAKLHQYNMLTKNLQSENIILKRRLGLIK